MLSKNNRGTMLRLTLAAAAAVAVTALTGCSNTDHSTMPTMGHRSGHDMTAPPSTSAASATAASADGQHNDADVMFAQAMIPHHQQAIEMSDMILAKQGIDTEVTALATQIKAAQAPEIATMSGWLAAWGQNPSPSMAMDHDMGGGMMSQADMDALDKATGKDAARLFLTGMVTHHQGAITMARQELTAGQNPDAKALAQRIIATQQTEIDAMKQLLEQL